MATIQFPAQGALELYLKNDQRLHFSVIQSDSINAALGMIAKEFANECLTQAEIKQKFDKTRERFSIREGYNERWISAIVKGKICNYSSSLALAP